MELKLDILLLDKSGNTIEELQIKKPETYYEFLNIIKSKMKLPENYNIYFQNENEKIIINNNENYKLAKDKLFIHNNDLNASIYSNNYGELSGVEQEILDEKYNCIICKEKIKNKQLMCYQCQNIYHKKCLEEWDNSCKSDNKTFSCPKCKYELPLIKWKAKVNYEDEKNNEAIMLVELNKNKNKIKEIIDNNIYDNYKDKFDILKNEYYKYIENTSNLLKNIFYKTLGIIALINNDNIKNYDRDFLYINEIYVNIINNFKIIENIIVHQMNSSQNPNPKNINKINIVNNLPIIPEMSSKLGVGIKSFDSFNYNQQKVIDYNNTTLNNNITTTNLPSNSVYDMRNGVGIPKIIDTNKSQFRTEDIAKIKDDYTNSAYNIASLNDNSVNITYSGNPFEYNNNPHTTTTTTTTITYTTKVLKSNANEINPTYKDSTIKDNAINITYYTKPVKFNNNPHSTTTTTTMIRPFATTTVTKVLKSNANFDNPSIKVLPKQENAFDVIYPTKPVENYNNHHFTTTTTTIYRPFITTTKVLKSDVNATYPTYKDSQRDFDEAVDVTYSSNNISRNNNQLGSTTTTKTLRPFTTTNTKFPEF